jgi:hypothetical protein
MTTLRKSTRSSVDDDSRRDFDGFDETEELRRLRVAIATGGPSALRFAAEAFRNIDEWLDRGGTLPEQWWRAGTARPNDPGGIKTLAQEEVNRAYRRRRRSKRRLARSAP